MGKTYYPGERMCSSDMMPQVVKINGSKTPQKKLYKMMNEAFDGKIAVLQVSWLKDVKWLCMQGYPSGIVWWRYDNGRTFARSEGGWNEILI